MRRVSSAANTPQGTPVSASRVRSALDVGASPLLRATSRVLEYDDDVDDVARVRSPNSDSESDSSFSSRDVSLRHVRVNLVSDILQE